MRFLLAAAVVGCHGDGGDGGIGGPVTDGGDDDDTTGSTDDTAPDGPDVGPNLTTTGSAESCVVLFGELDRVRGPDEGLPVGRTGRTLQAWIRTYNPAEQIAISYGRPSAGQGFQLGTSSGYPVLRVGTSSSEVVTGDVFVGDDHWHQLVAAWDGTTAIVMVDGAIAGVGTLTADTLEGDLIAGNTPTGDDTKPWIGWLDDVKIVLGPRSPDDVAADPEALAVAPDDVLMWWDFEQSGSGAGLAVTDLSGHGHDAVTVGLSPASPLFTPCR
jgi:hypothetical protein